MYIRNDLSYIKFETICVFLMVIEKFSQLNYLYTKSMESIIVSCCYKPPYGNWKNHCDHLQKIVVPQCKTNFTLLQEMQPKLFTIQSEF